MHAPVKAADDDVLRPRQGVGQAAIQHQPAHRAGAQRVLALQLSLHGLLGVQVRLELARHAALGRHRLECVLGAVMDLPAARCVFGCQAVITQHRQAPEFEVALRPSERFVWHRACLDQPAVPMVLFPQQRRIQSRPAVLLDFFRSSPVDVEIGAIPQLACGQLPCPLAHAVADVVPADDQVTTGIVHAAHEDVHVRVVGVVMGDRHPVQPRAQILLHLRQQVARVALQLQARAAFGRDDEPERVAIPSRPLHEPGGVGTVERAIFIERFGITAVQIHAVALDVIDMPLHGGRHGMAW